MRIPPYPISYLCLILFDINAAADRDMLKEFTIEDLDNHLREGNLLAAWKQRMGVGLGQGILDAEPGMAEWYLSAISDHLRSVRGRERRKYGVENNGFLMLSSLTAEMIQQGSGIKFKD